MKFLKKIRDQIDDLQQSWWIKILFGLLAFGATYLQYRDGGATIFFWLFLFITLFVMLLIVGLPIAKNWYLKQRRKWIENTRTEVSQNQKLEILKELLYDFENIEKAKNLSNSLNGRKDVRVLAILPIEHQLGVMLNIGGNENLQLGTRLMIYRNDSFTTNGDRIENPLGIIEVTYIQANNNCSQAIVIEKLDEDYWTIVSKQLNTNANITPPNNFVIPYEIAELSSLTIKDIETFRQYLEVIRTSLIAQSISSNIDKEIS